MRFVAAVMKILRRNPYVILEKQPKKPPSALAGAQKQAPKSIKRLLRNTREIQEKYRRIFQVPSKNPCLTAISPLKAAQK